MAANSQQSPVGTACGDVQHLVRLCTWKPRLGQEEGWGGSGPGWGERFVGTVIGGDGRIQF